MPILKTRIGSCHLISVWPLKAFKWTQLLLWPFLKIFPPHPLKVNLLNCSASNEWVKGFNFICLWGFINACHWCYEINNVYVRVCVFVPLLLCVWSVMSESWILRSFQWVKLNPAYTHRATRLNKYNNSIYSSITFAFRLSPPLIKLLYMSVPSRCKYNQIKSITRPNIPLDKANEGFDIEHHAFIIANQ